LKTNKEGFIELGKLEGVSKIGIQIETFYEQ